MLTGLQTSPADGGSGGSADAGRMGRRHAPGGAHLGGPRGSMQPGLGRRLDYEVGGSFAFESCALAAVVGIDLEARTYSVLPESANFDFATWSIPPSSQLTSGLTCSGEARGDVFLAREVADYIDNVSFSRAGDLIGPQAYSGIYAVYPEDEDTHVRTVLFGQGLFRVSAGVSGNTGTLGDDEGVVRLLVGHSALESGLITALPLEIRRLDVEGIGPLSPLELGSIVLAYAGAVGAEVVRHDPLGLDLSGDFAVYTGSTLIDFNLETLFDRLNYQLLCDVGSEVGLSSGPVEPCAFDSELWRQEIELGASVYEVLPFRFVVPGNITALSAAGLLGDAWFDALLGQVGVAAGMIGVAGHGVTSEVAKMAFSNIQVTASMPDANNEVERSLLVAVSMEAMLAPLAFLAALAYYARRDGRGRTSYRRGHLSLPDPAEVGGVVLSAIVLGLACYPIYVAWQAENGAANHVNHNVLTSRNLKTSCYDVGVVVDSSFPWCVTLELDTRTIVTRTYQATLSSALEGLFAAATTVGALSILALLAVVAMSTPN